jgi:hypothetical protein
LEGDEGRRRHTEHGGTLALDHMIRGKSACIQNGLFNSRRAKFSWRQLPTEDA